MPWTEHPTDTTARRIRESQSGLAARLAAVLTPRLQAAQTPTARAELQRLQELALNALSNEKAMGMLHSGFARPPQPKGLSGGRW